MKNRVGIDTIIARLRAEFTLEKLSELIDVDVKTISRWQAGTSEPRLSSLQRVIELCNERGIRWDDLFYFRTFMPWWKFSCCCRIALLSRGYKYE